MSMKSESKISKQWTWLTMLLIGMLTLGITSCDEDDSNTVTPEPEEPEEVGSAWVYGFSNNSPQGAVIYMGVSEEIPTQLDLNTSIELGSRVNTFSYGEDIYTWNSNASTITKWVVDRSTLEVSVENILSLASIGITGSSGGNPAFLSDTRAFVSDLAEGVMIEWNPETMAITQTYQVDPLPKQDDLIGNVFFSENRRSVSAEGKILMPVQYIPFDCCEYYDVGGAYLAVFDPATGTIEYNQDSRLISSNGIFLSDEAGNKYLAPTEYNFMVTNYFDVNENEIGSPFPILRVNDDGTYDPDFIFDVTDFIDTKLIAGVVTVFDNNVVVRHVEEDFEFPEAYADRWSFWGDGFKSSIVNFETGEVRDFTAFDGFSYDFFVGNIDGNNYFSAGLGGDNVTGTIIRQDGAEQFTTVTSVDGGVIQHINKLW